MSQVETIVHLEVEWVIKLIYRSVGKKKDECSDLRKIAKIQKVKADYRWREWRSSISMNKLFWHCWQNLNTDVNYEYDVELT